MRDGSGMTKPVKSRLAKRCTMWAKMNGMWWVGTRHRRRAAVANWRERVGYANLRTPLFMLVQWQLAPVKQGDKQCFNPHSAVLSVQWSARVYALLLLLDLSSMLGAFTFTFIPSQPLFSLHGLLKLPNSSGRDVSYANVSMSMMVQPT